MRWRIFAREPSAIFWTYGFPVVLALVLGIAFRNRPPEPVEVAVEAFPQAEAWRNALASNALIRVQWLTPEKAREALRVGRVSVVVSKANTVAAQSDDGSQGGGSRVYRFDPTRPERKKPVRIMNRIPDTMPTAVPNLLQHKTAPGSVLFRGSGQNKTNLLKVATADINCGDAEQPASP